MSGGPKRNSDKLNTIGIVVVGICGAALVHVSITLLQAFYMNDTSDVQTMADYGGQDTEFQRIRAEEFANITQCANVMGTGQNANKHSIPVDQAMRLVVEEAGRDPAMLVPVLGRADKPTIKAQFDRPVPLTTPGAAPAPAGAAPAPGAAVAPGVPAGPDSAPGSAPVTPNAPNLVPQPGAPPPNAGSMAPGPTPASPGRAVAPPGSGGTVPGTATTPPPAPASPAPSAPAPAPAR